MANTAKELKDKSDAARDALKEELEADAAMLADVSKLKADVGAHGDDLLRLQEALDALAQRPKEEVDEVVTMVRALKARIEALEEAVPDPAVDPVGDSGSKYWPELPGDPEDYDAGALAAWQVLGPRWLEVIQAGQRGSSGPIESPLRSTANKPLRHFVDSLSPRVFVSRDNLYDAMRRGMADDLAELWDGVWLASVPRGDGGKHLLLKSRNTFCNLVIWAGRDLGLWDEIEVNP